MSLTDGDATIGAQDTIEIDQSERLPLMEFSLEDLTTDREIRAVTLELNVRGFQFDSEYEVFGYAGDGTPTLSDAYASRDLLGRFEPTDFGLAEIPLDAGFVSDLVAAGETHLGLLVAPTGGGGSLSFSTREGGQFSEPPLLTINLGPESLPGDFNGDGRVDAADYTVWRDGLGAGFTQGDYDAWVGGYGAISQASTNAVPEPMTGLLSVIAIGAARLSRRRGPMI